MVVFIQHQRDIADRESQTQTYLHRQPRCVVRHPDPKPAPTLVEDVIEKERLVADGVISRLTDEDRFAFLPLARGQGYGFEAARAVLDFATRSLQLNRIVALTVPDNHASIRVLEKLGFRFDRMVSWMDPVGGSRLFVLEGPGCARHRATAGRNTLPLRD